MRFLIFVFLFPATVSAQDFTTPRAMRAQKEYEESIDRARKRYLVSLTEAEKIAKDNGNPDEESRIKEEKERIELDQAGDPVVRSRELLIGTTWDYSRPGQPINVVFLRDGTIRGTQGNWGMLTPTIAIKYDSRNVFVYEFDDKLSRFDVKAFGPVSSGWKVGKRLSPLNHSRK